MADLTVPTHIEDPVFITNPNVYLDPSGTYWYRSDYVRAARHGRNPRRDRIRCVVTDCAFCGVRFPAPQRSGVASKRVEERCCSRSCRLKHVIAVARAERTYWMLDESKRNARYARWTKPIGYRHVTDCGYVRIKVGKGYPGANVFGMALEHRVVMQEHLGRTLEKWETVHHKNGDRADNDLQNLELWQGANPKGVRATEAVKHCPTCTCERG